jgi:hypothetical protein
MAKEDTKKDMAQDKKTVKKAVGMHDKQQHGGKKTDLTKLKGGGCAKMAFGGVTSAVGNAMNAIKAQGAANPSMVKPAGAPAGRMIAAAPARPSGMGTMGGGMGRRGAAMTEQQQAAGKAAQQATIMAQQNRGQLPQKPIGLGSVVKGSTGPGTIRRAKGGGIEKRGKTRGKMC